MKRIIIIGAGISGLTTAWWLHRRFPRLEIIIVEKNSSAGGLIYTEQKGSFLFNLGPKGFATSGEGEFTLKLIHDLGLKSSLTFSHPIAKKRFVHFKGSCHRVSLFTLLRLGLPLTLIKDWFARRYTEDGTVEDFLKRHSSEAMIRNFWNPITVATCAGPSHLLSAHMAYPKLAKMEASHGSILRGSLCTLFSHKSALPSLATLRPSLSLLIDTLQEKLPAHMIFSTTALHIEDTAQGVAVHTSQGTLSGDLAVYTGPLHALPELIPNPEAKQITMKSSSWDLSCISVGWRTPIDIPKGYGMLFADEPPLLGIVFNSLVFPEQYPNQTVLSLLLEQRWYKDQGYAFTLAALSKYLNISRPPDAFSLFSPQDGLPLHHVGFLALRKNFLNTLPRSIKVVGQNLFGPGLNRCTAAAFHTVASL